MMREKEPQFPRTRTSKPQNPGIPITVSCAVTFNLLLEVILGFVQSILLRMILSCRSALGIN